MNDYQAHATLPTPTKKGTAHMFENVTKLADTAKRNDRSYEDPYAPPPWASLANTMQLQTTALDLLVGAARFSDRPQSDHGQDAWIGFESPIEPSTPLRMGHGTAMRYANDLLQMTAQEIKQLGPMQLLGCQHTALAIWLATIPQCEWGPTIRDIATCQQPYHLLAITWSTNVQHKIKHVSGGYRIDLTCLRLWTDADTEKAVRHTTTPPL